jgi:hypothetical protein
MRVTTEQRAIHTDTIYRWFARRRKTSIQKVLLDLKVVPPTRRSEDVFYGVVGKRTDAFVEAGTGEVWRPLKSPLPDRSYEMIGNVFSGESYPGIE